LYTGRLVNPGQLRSMVSTAITTAVAERGPVVISIPGDVAVADAPSVLAAGAAARHHDRRRLRRGTWPPWPA